MITKTPFELVKLLNVSLAAIEEIMNQVFKNQTVLPKAIDVSFIFIFMIFCSIQLTYC